MIKIDLWGYNLDLGTIIGIVSLIYAIIIAYTSTKKKQPIFYEKSNAIIEASQSRFPNLLVTYKHQPIKNFTVTKLGFLNRGKETIRRADIVDSNPIRIQTKEGVEILDATITYVKDKDNNFSISEVKGKNRVDITFDFLEKDQGGIIQVSHTGTSDEDINVLGTIIGGGHPVHKEIRIKISKGRWGYYKDTILVGFALLIILSITYSMIVSINDLLFKLILTPMWLYLIYFIVKNQFSRPPLGFEELAD